MVPGSAVPFVSIKQDVELVELVSSARMDRTTKATLWVAFIILGSYFVWFFLDCAMDDACHLVCKNGGRGGCHTEWMSDPKKLP